MAVCLDTIFSTLRVDPLADGVQVVPAALVQPPQPFAPLLPFTSRQPLLICGLGDAATVERVQTALLAVYQPQHPVTLADDGIAATTVGDLRNAARPQAGLCLYLPAQAVLDGVRSFDALHHITARLRAPGGCPWDRQQTHASLKPYVLEETYEVLEALDKGDLSMLAEELGDLLLQVVIQAQVAVEAGEFDMGDVVAAISSKLMRRHPHVFADVQVSGAQEVLRNWQAIKQTEKKGNGADEVPSSLLGGVPVQLPALAYAQAILERASRVGFGQSDADDCRGVTVDVDALSRAQTEGDKLAAYGDLLFALVHVARRLDVNAEEALRLAARRYRERFVLVEDLCRRRGLDPAGLSPAQRQALWQEAAAGAAAHTRL